jgi:hypothetical protein
VRRDTEDREASMRTSTRLVRTGSLWCYPFKPSPWGEGGASYIVDISLNLWHWFRVLQVHFNAVNNGDRSDNWIIERARRIQRIKHVFLKARIPHPEGWGGHSSRGQFEWTPLLYIPCGVLDAVNRRCGRVVQYYCEASRNKWEGLLTSDSSPSLAAENNGSLPVCLVREIWAFWLVGEIHQRLGQTRAMSLIPRARVPLTIPLWTCNQGKNEIKT